MRQPDMASVFAMAIVLALAAPLAAACGRDDAAAANSPAEAEVRSSAYEPAGFSSVTTPVLAETTVMVRAPRTVFDNRAGISLEDILMPLVVFHAGVMSAIMMIFLGASLWRSMRDSAYGPAPPRWQRPPDA